jgi:hypothetical protein
MDIEKPYGGLSNDRLTALINRDNQKTLVEGVDFTFGTPSDYSDSQGRNTQVTITPVPGKKYKGPADLHYKRLPLLVLDDLSSGYIVKVQIPGLPFSIHGMLSAINTALGLNLIEDEVQDVEYTEKLAEYPLRINQGISLAWVDSEYQFKVHHIGDDVLLSDAIVFNVLDGLEFVQLSE